MEKKKVSVKTTLEYTKAVAYVEDLLNSLKSGKIVVQTDEDHVVLSPSQQVGIKVEAKSSKGKQEFSFKLTWEEGESVKLTISDCEQAIPMPPAGEIVPASEEKELATKEEAKVPAMKPKKKTKEKKK